VPAFAFASSQASGDNPEQRDKVADENIRKPTAHYLPSGIRADFIPP
jgi:hypothetical protein